MSDPSGPPPAEPEQIFAALHRHGVRYVLIGALAAQLQGAPLPRTRDVDITPANDAENLLRLSEALREMDARVRTTEFPHGLAFDHDAASLARAAVWNLVTRHGELDLSFVPSGTQGFDDLARRARAVPAFGVEVPVADLEDILRSKEAAARPKDALHLPILYQTLRRRGQAPPEVGGGSG